MRGESLGGGVGGLSVLAADAGSVSGGVSVSWAAFCVSGILYFKLSASSTSMPSLCSESV